LRKRCSPTAHPSNFQFPFGAAFVLCYARATFIIHRDAGASLHFPLGTNDESKLGRHICVFCVILFAVGCNSSSTTPPPPPAPVTLSLAPSSALLFSTQSIKLTATDSDGDTDVVWPISGATGATVDATGNFTAPAVTQNITYTVTATSMKDPTKTSSTNVTVLASGQVATTNNPQVASYTLTAPADLNVFIQFSSDTSYNLKTWTQPAPATGQLSFLVAGMLGSTQYHMRAAVQAADGTFANDLDHTFTTQSQPTASLPSLTVTTSPGMTPQPGIEMLDLIGRLQVSYR
jgi:hypothetical protein